VDRVGWVDGVTQPLSHVILLGGISARSTLDEVLAVVAEEAPDSPVLSVVTADNDGIGTVEPELVFEPSVVTDRLTYVPIKWVVRVLESERLETYVVWDDSNVIWQMTEDGGPVQVGGSVGPTPSPAPWPPAGSVVVKLTSQVGAGMPPAQVAVVDHSGRLIGTAEKGALDPGSMIAGSDFGAYPEPGLPGRVHLVWAGGVCDSRMVVTVAPDLRSITLDMGPQPPCDAMGIGRQLVLDFSGSVDVPSIELVDATSASPPASSDAPGFELDCGPLGPDTCDAKAADIIAATPTKRVVSITFSGECGSYVVMFDDGTGNVASIDCILPPSPS